MLRLENRDRVVLSLDGVVSFDVWRCGRTVVDEFDAKKSGTNDRWFELQTSVLYAL